MFQPSLYARRRGVNGESGLLSEGKGAARGGDRTAEIFGGFDPFLDDDFDVGESFLVGLSIGGAAGKFGNLGDKGFVGLTPIDDDFVPRHRLLPPSDRAFPALAGWANVWRP